MAETETEIFYVCIYDSSSEEIVGFPTTSGIQKYADVVRDLCRVVDPRMKNGAKRTWSKEDLLFHAYKKDDRIHICVSTAQSNLRIVYDLLLVLASTELDISPPRPLRRFLKKQMKTFNNPRSDEVASSKASLGKVQGLVKKNLDKVLKNVESVKAIEDKSAGLLAGASEFATHARELREMSRPCSRNRIILFVTLGILLVIVAIVVIVVVVCSVTLS